MGPTFRMRVRLHEATGLLDWTIGLLDSPKLQNTSRLVQNKSRTYLFTQ